MALAAALNEYANAILRVLESERAPERVGGAFRHEPGELLKLPAASPPYLLGPAGFCCRAAEFPLQKVADSGGSCCDATLSVYKIRAVCG